MPTDIRFSVANVPGRTAKAAEAVAAAGINILGMCGDIRPGDQWGYIHFLVEDAAGARSALESVGCEILDIHEADLVQAEDRPGALAEILREYSDNAENIEVLYTGVDNNIIIGTENNRREFLGRRVSEATYRDTRTPD